jgi:hypothetical protein
MRLAQVEDPKAAYWLSGLSRRWRCSERHVRSILLLAFLAPEITRSAIDRRLPERSGVPPALMSLLAPWHEQTRRLGLARAA